MKLKQALHLSGLLGHSRDTKMIAFSLLYNIMWCCGESTCFPPPRGMGSNSSNGAIICRLSLPVLFWTHPFFHFPSQNELFSSYWKCITAKWQYPGTWPVTRDEPLRTSAWDATILVQGWEETELIENCHLDTILFSLLFRINDYESCAEMLLDTLGDEIVNMCDKKDRWAIWAFLSDERQPEVDFLRSRTGVLP